MVRNMILLERDDEAKRAIGKLIDAGAMGVKNNENFLLIKERFNFFFFKAELNISNKKDEIHI